MGNETDQQVTASAARQRGGANAPSPKPPLAMSKTDHTVFVDLLLQQAAESAKRAVAQTEPKSLVEHAQHALADIGEALAAYSMPDTKTSPRQMFRSVDGAFMGLYDLFYALRDARDPVALAYAPRVQELMTRVNDRFAPLGWKLPKSTADGHARAKKAGDAGVTNLSAIERGRLGRMHVRAARQYLLGDWDNIVGGQLQHAVASAADNLRDAMALLIDPHLSGEVQAASEEVAVTGQVLERVYMVLQQRDASKVGELRELATAFDSLLGLVG
ncbi:MAG TPA: hypothetical protein VK427_16555, partial [Kofleriaceae bacterium]|nr:hypothetical protein [Kofleriaceae bacterium]